MDLTTLAGVILGVTCILAGQALEGGDVGSIGQLTAAVIVLGGTMGAVVTQFPIEDLRRGLREARYLFRSTSESAEPLVRRILDLARLSRKEGLLALEGALRRTDDAFLREAVQALIDGHDGPALRGMLETVIDRREQHRDAGPRIFEAAGGYAPTIGILGAVLGLIHVMENLSDPSRLGSGIAVAFVATIYGVGSANLFFLPFAQKLKMKIASDVLHKQLVVEGVCGLREGVNPQTLEKRMRSFLEAPAQLRGARA